MHAYELLSNTLRQIYNGAPLSVKKQSPSPSPPQSSPCMGEFNVSHNVAGSKLSSSDFEGRNTSQLR